METRTEPLHTAVNSKPNDEHAQTQLFSDELARLLKQSRLNSIRHHRILKAQFAESQKFISDNLAEIQAVLRGFSETVTDVRISDWRRESYQLLKLGRKSVDTLQKFCQDIEQPLNASCEKLELTTCQSVKTFHSTLDAVYSDNFRRLIHNAEQSIEQVTEESTHYMAVMRKYFNWTGCVVAALISLMVAIGFSSYLNAEWPWETHATASWQRHVGRAAMSVWPKLSNSDQQLVLNSLSEIH